MPRIVTLTMNPTIDVAYEVRRMQHTHKMRTQNERYAPGGGGINVARVFGRLGGSATSVYLAGGATGPALDGLLEEHQLDCRRIAIAGATRVASAVLELESGKEYRFTPSGPVVSESEWRACLSALDREPAPDALVLSGSLPRGVPDDFYTMATRSATARNVPVVLDTSGPALAASLAEGGLYLVKPSQGELEQFAGRALETVDEIGGEALRLVEAGRAQFVAVTMGHRGAVLAHADGVRYIPALEIEARSAVGAGDSFVAAMIHGLLSGKDPAEAFCLGMAAGSAAVLSPGSDLASAEDIARLHTLICARA